MRATLLHAWMKLSLRIHRGLNQVEDYLAQPHGEYHWCDRCGEIR